MLLEHPGDDQEEDKIDHYPLAQNYAKATNWLSDIGKEVDRVIYEFIVILRIQLARCYLFKAFKRRCNRAIFILMIGEMRCLVAL